MTTRASKKPQVARNRMKELEGPGGNGKATVAKKKPASKKSTAGKAVVLTVPKPDIQTLRVKVRGTSSLIMNKWSEKALSQMRDKQQGKPTAGKAPKNPEQCFKDATYFHPKSTTKKPRYQFPAIAFKKAMVRAAKGVGIDMTDARAAFRIPEEFVEIQSKHPPIMREDPVRNSGKVADLRYRPEFTAWGAEFDIRFNALMISPAQLANLVQHAGFSTGVGEWRNEKDGLFGAFELAQ